MITESGETSYLICSGPIDDEDADRATIGIFPLLRIAAVRSYLSASSTFFLYSPISRFIRKFVYKYKSSLPFRKSAVRKSVKMVTYLGA
jgi:hypothetical protein